MSRVTPLYPKMFREAGERIEKFINETPDIPPMEDNQKRVLISTAADVLLLLDNMVDDTGYARRELLTAAMVGIAAWGAKNSSLFVRIDNAASQNPAP